MAIGIRRADHATPFYPQTLALTSPICGGRSVGIVRSRIEATVNIIIITTTTTTTTTTTKGFKSISHENGLV
jgi:hypothetical protein